MDTLLDALQEGRLIELPDNNKDHALQFLAHILEAIPSVPAGTGIVELVMARESSITTAIGLGWACPHARVAFDEDLMCVVGWSPAGIDYGAPDGVPVSVIAMYLVPVNQRNHYLREISILAKALTAYGPAEKWRSAKELNEVRDDILDLISSAKETVGPDARARMIQLQVRAAVEAVPAPDLSNLLIEPVTLVAAPGVKPVVLAQNPNLVDALDAAPGLVDAIASSGVFQNGGWRVVKRGTTAYQAGRVAYDCLAIKISSPTPQQRGGGKR
jgi:mannitol/fructose-specific phosphotransferase system IIA component (Ntr-type)